MLDPLSGTYGLGPQNPERCPIVGSDARTDCRNPGNCWPSTFQPHIGCIRFRVFWRCSICATADIICSRNTRNNRAVDCLLSSACYIRGSIASFRSQTLLFETICLISLILRDTLAPLENRTGNPTDGRKCPMETEAKTGERTSLDEVLEDIRRAFVVRIAEDDPDGHRDIYDALDDE